MNEISLPEIRILESSFLQSYLCDCLWAYSWTSALMLLFRDRIRIRNLFLIAVLYEVVLEVAQLLPWVHATFDIGDILLEVAASILSIIILKGDQTI